jgi:predicted outer membrane repeat protein
MYWGGGVYAADFFTCADKCLIGGNMAGFGGGGVYVKGEHGNFTMKKGFLVNNFAGLIGGAIYVSEYCSFVMEGGLLLKNRAAKAGNAFVTSGAVVINGGIIENEELSPEDNLEDIEFAMPSETANTDIAIAEKGKVILKEGSFYGNVGMKFKNQFEDLREKKGRTILKKVIQGER